MTKNRATKQAVRQHMQATGEPYTLAARAAQQAASAWETEDGIIVIYGTHDAATAMAAFQRYYREDAGFTPDEEWWTAEVDDINAYDKLARRWTLPKEDEEPFDLLPDAGAGRVPFMFGHLV